MGCLTFRSNEKQYKKVIGKRFRLPRKVKKHYKAVLCKIIGFSNKELKFSYIRLNRYIECHYNANWSYAEDKLKDYETAYKNK
jgi:hypothetical protein